jgi:hypothetical protein
LETVQDLILAGFNSPRESIVNVTITFWNDFVDLATDLLLDIDYPEKLINAALCLRSIGDVHLPPGCSGKENEPQSESRTFIAFSDYGSQPSTTPLAVRAFGPPNHARRLSPMPAKKDQPMMKSPASKLTPRRKLRHEDSQIVFEPIPSSSPVRSAVETQNLTDHQKEVLERQKDQAAAMFRDIGSDDISAHSGRKLVINSDIQVVSSDSVEEISRPSTPNVDVQDAADDEVPSSPITASQGRRQYRSSSSNPRSPAIPDVPSSPPSASKESSRPVIIADQATATVLPIIIADDNEVEMQDLEEASAVFSIINDESSDVAHAEPEIPETEMEDLPVGNIADGFDVSSDDLPSSQLVSEMLASRSSPIPSRIEEVSIAALNTSQLTTPEERGDTQSTMSILRGQKTLDEIFSDGIAQSSEDRISDSQHGYGTRLKSSQASTVPQSEETEKPLKRKRGRPSKNSPRYTAWKSVADQGPVRSSSRSSRPTSSHQSRSPSQHSTSSRGVSTYELDTEMEGRVSRAKRRKSAGGAAYDVAAEAEEDPEAMPENENLQEDEPDARSILNPKSIMARIQSLIADAKQVTWSRDEQMDMGDLLFQLQASTRGYERVGHGEEEKAN